jgi:solute carrier family 50 protein (sugar transporter)
MAPLDIFLLYVCPAAGGVLATVMFGIPVSDLRTALRRGDLGSLNPTPWMWASGNCLGWIIYGYLQEDPFLVAANLPGLLVTVWLNYGAAKLQYYSLYRRHELRRRASGAHTAAARQQDEQWDASPAFADDQDELLESSALESSALTNSDDDDVSDAERLVFVPQETGFFRIMAAWAILATYATWFTDRRTACFLVGWTVNLNLVFFYGAPLNTIRTVVKTGDSAPIHRPTLTMNFINTSFWMLYGLARHNPIILLPNAIGFLLGVAQAVLCASYPRRKAAYETAPPMAAAVTQDVVDFA